MRNIVNFGGKYRQGSSQHRKNSISGLYAVLILGVAMMLMIVIPMIPRRAYASKPSVRQNDVQLARLSKQTSIESAGRGNPWINMDNGHDLLTSFRSPDDSEGVLNSAQTAPLTLAADDLNGDGVPDLISGYATANAGAIVVRRGNGDAIAPNSPTARQHKQEGTFTSVPFLSPASLFEVNASPDFLVSGDFDADGHKDVLIASRNSNILTLLPGDGHGELGAARTLTLPGNVTALTSGEINRADGLSDFVVAVNGASGPQVMVFEGPEGAMKSTTETFNLPAAASAISLGYLDADGAGDLAIAAGRQLMIIYGRDRKLSLGLDAQRKVAPARISRRQFSSAITSLAIGDFTGDVGLDLAVLTEDGSIQVMKSKQTAGTVQQAAARPAEWAAETLATGLKSANAKLICARLSALSHETLVMMDGSEHQLRVWMDDDERRERNDETLAAAPAQHSEPVTFAIDDEPTAVLPMRLNIDALSDLVVLRRGHSDPTILSTAATVIGVCNQSDCNSCGSLRDAINAANSPSTVGGALIAFNDGVFSGTPTISVSLGALPTITRATTIDGATTTTSCGPSFTAAPAPDSAVSPQETLNGIVLNGSGSTANGFTIAAGGCAILDFFVDSFTSSGILISQNRGSFVQNNTIGLGSDNSPKGNNVGVTINAPGNTVGPNVISANNTGIKLDGNTATDNLIGENTIGTDITGLTVIGNNQSGVVLSNGATRNLIGGSRNKITKSGQHGVSISNANSNLVQGNLIQQSGSNGVFVSSSASITVGGTDGSLTNDIQRNSGNGVEITGSSATNNLVQGNRIGAALDADGKPVDRGNITNGVSFSFNASGNMIGGTANGAGNIIALNRGDGVLVNSGNHNTILSNLIFNNTGLGIHLIPGANDDVKAPVLTSTTLTSVPNQPQILSVTSTAAGLTIAFSFSGGTPNQNYLFDFYLKSACECKFPCIGLLDRHLLPIQNLKVDGSGSFNGQVTFPDATVPPGYGFVNGSATNPAGSTSQFSQCLALASAPGCNFTLSPTSQHFAVGGGNGQFTVNTATGCSWAAIASNSSMITILGSGSGTGGGTLNFTVSANPGASQRTSTITVQGQTFTVNQDGSQPGPVITLACKQKKALVVTGSGFVDGAQLFVNGAKQKKVFVDSATQVTARKAGKIIQPGDQVQIINPDSSSSAVFTYTPCSSLQGARKH